jgi:hypothetical protein
VILSYNKTQTNPTILGSACYVPETVNLKICTLLHTQLHWITKRKYNDWYSVKSKIIDFTSESKYFIAHKRQSNYGEKNTHGSHYLTITEGFNLNKI